MPQVRGRQTKQAKQAPARRRRKPAPEPEIYDETVDASSVVFGLVMVLAVIVAGAALMGGSLSKVGDRFSGTMDGVASTLGFAVSDVKVVGLEEDPGLERLVSRMAEVEPGENIFRADPHVVRRRILSTGQVTEARVYRLWPNQILIHASPAEPVALWHNGESWKVVDSLGRVVDSLAAQDYPDLVRIAGREAPEGTPALMRALGRHDALEAQLSYAQRVSTRRWDLKLRNGVTVQLPSDGRIDRAAIELADLDRQTGLTDRPVARIDLRVPGKAYLKPERSVGAGSAPAES